MEPGPVPLWKSHFSIKCRGYFCVKAPCFHVTELGKSSVLKCFCLYIFVRGIFIAYLLLYRVDHLLYRHVVYSKVSRDRLAVALSHILV